jgi:hypothetical protein
VVEKGDRFKPEKSESHYRMRRYRAIEYWRRSEVRRTNSG